MTYVLDTNAISEIFKPRPNPKTISWMQDHEGQLYLTTISIMEMYYGVMRLPEGKRKESFRALLAAILHDEKERIYDFDSFSAFLCAEMKSDAEAIGRTPQLSNCMIAAICKRNNATLVTRNVKDFDYLGIKVENPFEYESPTLLELKRRESQ